MEYLALYAILYALFSICVIWPPTEFIAAGLTLEHFFSRFLGREYDNFVEYHLKRISLNVVAHSALPFGFFIYLDAIDDKFSILDGPNALPFVWRIIYNCALLLPLGAVTLVTYWRLNDWRQHPTIKDLRQYAPENWRAVATQIDVEYKSFEKFSVALGGIRRVVVTDSWIFLISTYQLCASQQQDVQLTLIRADEHRVSHHFAPEDGPPAGAVQFLDIEVRNAHRRIAPFTIRLNSALYGDLRTILRRPIDSAQNVMVQTSLSERFVEAFVTEVDGNEMVQLDASTLTRIDFCMGCSAKLADAKLISGCDSNQQRMDPDTGRPLPQCRQCFCRPMWCVDCLGRWFASRQNQSSPEKWLGGKAPCPTCRATFCVLDVRRVGNLPEEG